MWHHDGMGGVHGIRRTIRRGQHGRTRTWFMDAEDACRSLVTFLLSKFLVLEIRIYPSFLLPSYCDGQRCARRVMPRAPELV